MLLFGVLRTWFEALARMYRRYVVLHGPCALFTNTSANKTKTVTIGYYRATERS